MSEYQCLNCRGTGKAVIGVHEVSAEMAADACEPSMRGQLVEEFGRCPECGGNGVVEGADDD